MSKKLFALIKWVGGEDDRKYTVGVPVDWIKSFNYDEYKSSSEDNTYAIEWHESSKQPLGSWNCYDGYVIEVSERLSFLQQKLNQIDGVLSPTKVCKSTVPLNDSSTDVQTTHTISSQDQISSGWGENGKQNNSEQSTGSSKAKLSRPKPSAKHTPPPTRKQRRLELEESHVSEQGSGDEAESGIVEINNSSNVIKATIKGNQKIEHQLAKVCKELRHQRKKRGRRGASSDDSSDSSDDEPTVRIGPKNSGVHVTISQWRTAKAQSTYTAMGISLVMALFPMDVLLRSNLKGGIRKITRSPDVPKFEALNKKIREAIYYSVESYHLKTFNAAGLGIAINNKLNSLRRAEKIRSAEPQRQSEPEDRP